MHKLTLIFAPLCAFTIAQSAQAGELRDFCADRPGLGTPACIVDKGHAVIEIGAADWTHDNSGGVVSDSVTSGQLLVRVGVSSHVEAQVGWNGYSSQRELAGGVVSKVHGGGDALVGLKIGLSHPDGSGTAIALQPYATIPVGKAGIGTGDWTAGIIVPVSFALKPGLGLTFSPQISGQANASGHGHHLAFGGAAGFEVQLAKNLSFAAEAGWQRDEDPDGHSSSAVGGLSFAYLASPNLQLDGGVNLRLGGEAPDREIYVGVSFRL